MNVDLRPAPAAISPPITLLALTNYFLSNRLRCHFEREATELGVPVEPYALATARAVLYKAAHSRNHHEKEFARTFVSLNVDVVDIESVRQYLLSHHDMFDLVIEMCRATSREFEMGSKVSLELYRDPEIAGTHLVIYVRQRPYSSDIIQRTNAVMDRFAEDLANSTGWVLLTTDFQPPR
jgi:hypothetical protein